MKGGERAAFELPADAGRGCGYTSHAVVTAQDTPFPEVQDFCNSQRASEVASQTPMTVLRRWPHPSSLGGRARRTEGAHEAIFKMFYYKIQYRLQKVTPSVLYDTHC